MRRLHLLHVAAGRERSRPDAVPVRPRRRDGSRGGSNRESVEPAVDDGQRARHERRSVADEVVNRTQQLLRLGEASGGRVGDDRPRTVGVRTVLVGQQRAVLVRQQKARDDGVDAHLGAELHGGEIIIFALSR